MPTTQARQAGTETARYRPAPQKTATLRKVPAGVLPPMAETTAATSDLVTSAAQLNMEMAQFVARRWQAHVDYWSAVAACKDPMSLPRINAAFLQQTFDGYRDEWQRLIGTAAQHPDTGTDALKTPCNIDGSDPEASAVDLVNNVNV